MKKKHNFVHGDCIASKDGDAVFTVIRVMPSGVVALNLKTGKKSILTTGIVHYHKLTPDEAKARLTGKKPAVVLGKINGVEVHAAKKGNSVLVNENGRTTEWNKKQAMEIQKIYTNLVKMF